MMRRHVFLGFLFFAIQQLSGENAINFYAPDIFNTFFTEEQALLGTLRLSTISLVVTTLTVTVVDRYGRTKLLVYGGAVMAICFIIISVLASMETTLALGWTVLGVSAVFNVAFALSCGPAFFVLCSEMFPYKERSKATGITTMSHSLFASFVAAVFPVASTASLAGSFIFFAACIVLGTSVVYFLQVETSGVTSAQIEQAYLTHKPTFKRKDW